ncbi:hypothetical protein HGM15179_018281 [Zosterops borbonicus]|uniref:Uncharacterized protein n=1 Tax=Zosterops borbonicus TaxID=364589 RepID=A0A8K1LCE7_9PASS|nr:hypothetical protein HGM15179_018281 [Zosterops borbonicus]
MGGGWKEMIFKLEKPVLSRSKYLFMASQGFNKFVSVAESMITQPIDYPEEHAKTGVLEVPLLQAAMKLRKTECVSVPVLR